MQETRVGHLLAGVEGEHLDVGAVDGELLEGLVADIHAAGQIQVLQVVEVVLSLDAEISAVASAAPASVEGIGWGSAGSASPDAQECLGREYPPPNVSFKKLEF